MNFYARMFLNVLMGLCTTTAVLLYRFMSHITLMYILYIYVYVDELM